MSDERWGRRFVDYHVGTGRSPGSVFRSEGVLMRGLPMLGVAVAALLAGCEGSKSTMTTDVGPNEVLFKVPSMT